MMKNLVWEMRRLGKVPLARKFAKRFFSSVFQHGKTYTIRSGPLKGVRWFVHKDHQFWMPLGQYETQTANWIQSQLEPGMCFYDIGGNAGYFSLLGSREVGASGTVQVFEPVPVNVEVINHQIENNSITNIKLHNLALSDTDGHTTFAVESNNANSHLANVEIVHATSAPSSLVEVRTATIDSLIQSSLPKPDIIKIDVEGAEVLVLEGAKATLRKYKPNLLVSTHSAILCSEVKTLLSEIGYHVSTLQGFEHELIATPNSAD